MSPKLFSLNSVIERRKPQESTDELAIVKAAAWAWYQHGSGSEGKAMSKSEFNVARTQHATRPSRYKLEAMSMTKEAKERPSFYPNKSLLDTYEVQSISRHLDRLIESAHNKVGNSNNSANNAASMDNGKRKMNKKKRMSKGFWPRHAIVCGGGDDVVHGNALSAKRVPVVNLAKCLARAGSAL